MRTSQSRHSPAKSTIASCPATCAYINPCLQTDFDDLSNVFSSLCLKRGSSKTKNQGAQIKKTICKVSACVTFSCGDSLDARAKQVDSPAALPGIDGASSADNSRQKRSLRQTSHKKSRVVVCTWGARCSRPSCSFFHASPAANFVLPDLSLVSKLCKFGALCRRAACVFCHPSPAAGRE